jgi:hypothetical protein
MHGHESEMGGTFTGVKNQKLRRVAGVLLAAIVAASAAELALVEPREALAQLTAKGAGTTVLQVGPNVLYRSKHIPTARYAGPGSTAPGLELLRTEAGKLARDRQVLIYCGCCPWDRCPNVKPAMALLKEMGFTNVKAIHLETGFKLDWIDKGYAVE